jgi:hypothetical protein
MSAPDCNLQESVREAIITGGMNDAIQSHVSACLTCREVVRLTQWMRRFAAASKPGHSLPNSSYLWWKAQVDQRERAEKSARRLMLMIQGVTFVALFSLLTGWLIRNWDEIRKSLADWTPEWVTYSFPSIPLPLIYLSLGFVCVSIVLVLRAVFSDD